MDTINQEWSELAAKGGDGGRREAVLSVWGLWIHRRWFLEVQYKGSKLKAGKRAYKSM